MHWNCFDPRTGRGTEVGVSVVNVAVGILENALGTVVVEAGVGLRASCRGPGCEASPIRRPAYGQILYGSIPVNPHLPST